MKKKSYLFIMIAGYLLLVAGITTVLTLLRDNDTFFFNLAASVILSWIILLIVYFIWAIYFYNVNFGWEDEDWERLRNQKDLLGGSELLDLNGPESNPHEGETLGLPPGTVRGAIALSLLVSGMALIIASFQLDQKYTNNQYVIDNFEFFKTAFLMMIAFYFGNKSLEVLNQKGGRNQEIKAPNVSSPEGATLGEVPSIRDTMSHGVATAASIKNVLRTKHKQEEDKSPSDFDDKESLG